MKSEYDGKDDVLHIATSKGLQAAVKGCQVNFVVDSTPYKNDFDFGTGDFTITGYWELNDSLKAYIVALNDSLKAYIVALKVLKDPSVHHEDKVRNAKNVVDSVSPETMAAFLAMFRNDLLFAVARDLVNDYAEMPAPEGTVPKFVIATNKGVYSVEPNGDFTLWTTDGYVPMKPNGEYSLQAINKKD